MTEAYQTEFLDESYTLPAHTMEAEDRDALEALSHNGYEIRYGLTAAYAGSIAVLANQGHIREFSPKDAADRFKTIPDSEKWLAGSGGVGMFILLKDDDWVQRVAGYGWTTPRENPAIPGSQTAFEIRLGESARDKKLAATFGRMIIAGSAAIYGSRNFWLETWESNSAAVRAFHRIGFEITGAFPQKRQDTIGREYEDHRLFMALKPSKY
jgi:RimJ/RimL family protein N-acetyltransferase